MTTTLNTPKRKRGNPTGKSHEVPRARAALLVAGIDPNHLSDADAVSLSERVTKGFVAVEAVHLAVADNAEPRRLLVLEERARVAIEALPRALRSKCRTDLARALAVPEVTTEREPQTVRDILAAERAVLAKRRGTLTVSRSR